MNFCPKVNQKPGGNSSIVLGSEKTQFEENKYNDRAPPMKSILVNPSSEKFFLKDYGYQQPDKNDFKGGQKQEDKPQVHTSVKVANPPGGRSQITFG